MSRIYLCDDSQPRKTLALCAEFGFGVEVQSFYKPDILANQPGLLDEHREMLAGRRDTCLHGPFADLCAGSTDPLLREVARKRYLYAHDMALALGIPRVVLHHGYVPGTSPHVSWLRRWPAFWKELLAGTDTGVRFHIENMLEHNADLLADVIDEVGSERLDVCLDIGHAHYHGTGSVVDWVQRLGKRIGYLHLHDNDGTGDQHRGFGLGTLPLRKVLDALWQHAPGAIWAIEAGLDEQRQSIEWLERNGYLETNQS